MGCKLTPAASELGEPIPAAAEGPHGNTGKACVVHSSTSFRRERERGERKKISRPNPHEIVPLFMTRPPIDTAKSCIKSPSDTHTQPPFPLAFYFCLNVGRFNQVVKKSHPGLKEASGSRRHNTLRLCLLISAFIRQ